MLHKQHQDVKAPLRLLHETNTTHSASLTHDKKVFQLKPYSLGYTNDEYHHMKDRPTADHEMRLCLGFQAQMLDHRLALLVLQGCV